MTRLANRTSDTDRPNADAIDVFLILLLATAIDIFVLSLATQFVGSAALLKLPDFITSTYTAIWASLASGVAGIGLVVVKALGTQRTRRPNYLMWTLVVAAGLLATIIALAFLTKVLNPYPRPDVPREAYQIDLSGKAGVRKFEFSALPGSATNVRMVGTYSSKGQSIEGEVTEGQLDTSEQYQLIFPDHLSRVAIRSCYHRKMNGIEQMDVFPMRSTAENSAPLNVSMKNGRQSIQLPRFKFSFPVPTDAENGRIWLCAGIENSVGYIPVQ